MKKEPVSEVVMVRFTKAQREKLARAADYSDMSLSAFIRNVANWAYLDYAKTIAESSEVAGEPPRFEEAS